MYVSDMPKSGALEAAAIAGSALVELRNLFPVESSKEEV
jgi:hypothetical protein